MLRVRSDEVCCLLDSLGQFLIGLAQQNSIGGSFNLSR